MTLLKRLLAVSLFVSLSAHAQTPLQCDAITAGTVSPELLVANLIKIYEHARVSAEELSSMRESGQYFTLSDNDGEHKTARAQARLILKRLEQMVPQSDWKPQLVAAMTQALSHLTKAQETQAAVEEQNQTARVAHKIIPEGSLVDLLRHSDLFAIKSKKNNKSYEEIWSAADYFAGKTPSLIFQGISDKDSGNWNAWKGFVYRYSPQKGIHLYEVLDTPQGKSLKLAAEIPGVPTKVSGRFYAIGARKADVLKLFDIDTTIEELPRKARSLGSLECPQYQIISHDLGIFRCLSSQGPSFWRPTPSGFEELRFDKTISDYHGFSNHFGEFVSLDHEGTEQLFVLRESTLYGFRKEGRDLVTVKLLDAGVAGENFHVSGPLLSIAGSKDRRKNGTFYLPAIKPRRLQEARVSRSALRDSFELGKNLIGANTGKQWRLFQVDPENASVSVRLKLPFNLTNYLYSPEQDMLALQQGSSVSVYDLRSPAPLSEQNNTFSVPANSSLDQWRNDTLIVNQLHGPQIRLGYQVARLAPGNLNIRALSWTGYLLSKFQDIMLGNGAFTADGRFAYQKRTFSVRGQDFSVLTDLRDAIDIE